MRFAKLHGLGNSYVYIDLVTQSASGVDWSELARRVSGKAFGIGSDGLILLLPSDQADLRMRMFNTDGSEGEMCGNGIRCLARYAADTGLVQGDQLRVETGAGVLSLQLVRRNGVISAVRVDMGQPRLRRAQIPMAGDTDDRHVVDEPLSLDENVYRITSVSMGNPHCILLVDDVDNAPVHTLGPRIESHPAFPQRTNVEFIQVVDESHLRMRVWERGSGETMACGTGACAAVVATAMMHLTGRKVMVHLLGGTLEVEWASNDHVYMLGPCEMVCSGVLSDEWLRL